MADASTFRCPDERYDITRAVHLGRLTRFYPKCNDCQYREEVVPSGSSPAGHSEHPRRLRDINIFHDECVQGVCPNDIDKMLVRRFGQAVVNHVSTMHPGHDRKSKFHLVVGRDGRSSSDEIFQTLGDTIRLAGLHVIDVGQVTTPGLVRAVCGLEVCGGVMITGGSEPARYNGFRVYRSDGSLITSQNGLADIERFVKSDREVRTNRRGELKTTNFPDAYVTYLLRFAGSLKPLTIAVDTGNAVAGRFIPPLFAKLPCHLVPVNLEIDGKFPNHTPDPGQEENLEQLRQAVRESHADVGFAIDGDGQRCFVVDETGQAVPGHVLAALLARFLLNRHPKRAVVYDARASWVLREEIERTAGRPIREQPGLFSITRAMATHDAILGADVDGRFYYGAMGYTTSGLVTMLEVLRILSTGQRPMSQHAASVTRYYRSGPLVVDCDDPEGKLAELPVAFANGHAEYHDGVSILYRDWWFNVRHPRGERRLELRMEGKTRKALTRGESMVRRFLDEPVGLV